MKPSEIITADMERRGQDPQQGLNFVNGAIKKLNAVLLREGDSLMLLIPIAPGSAELHFYTADAPLSLVKAFRSGWKHIKESELKKVYADITNPQVAQLTKSAGWNVQPSDSPKYNWMAIVQKGDK
jgi:hypothetical protein